MDIFHQCLIITIFKTLEETEKGRLYGSIHHHSQNAKANIGKLLVSQEQQMLHDFQPKHFEAKLFLHYESWKHHQIT